jgi:ferrochelatase
MRYSAEPPLPPQPPPAGVLIGNLGSPAAPTGQAVGSYLRQILGDPRVIEAPRLLWWLILNLVIIPRRRHRSARLYQKVWSDQGSPLLVTSRLQAEALQAELGRRFDRTIPVATGMRYGEPALATGLDQLRRAGCRRILVLPLFPQASATSYGSYIDAVMQVISTWRWVPELRTVAGYHDDDTYLDALAASVREHRATGTVPGERLLISFHGIPQSYADAGDPYPDQCRTTATQLARRLGLSDEQWRLTFQSRFGRARWLEPYTDEVLSEWGREGGTASIICPGFSADCLETLEEIAISSRQLFLAAGGQELRYIPALNHRPDHINALAGLAERHLQGWIR